MKFGFRTPSLKKRVSARTSLKRVVRHKIGVKAPRGMGIITNPKKAVYNKVYRKTTFGIEDLAKIGRSKSVKAEPKSTEFVSFSIKSPILDKHFELSEKIPELYKKRETDGVEKTIEVCREQIDLALQAKAAFLKQYPDQPLPAHSGYRKLRIILEKQGRYDEAIALCNQAKEQGWADDWEKQISILQKKQSK